MRRPVGGPAVMRAQQARIIEIPSLPKVIFQVMPFTVEAHPGLIETFTILEFGKPTVSGIVYVEGAAGNIYLESATGLERYKRIFSRLQSIALDPGGSAAMIRRLTATYEDGKIEVAAQDHSRYQQRAGQRRRERNERGKDREDSPERSGMRWLRLAQGSIQHPQRGVR